MEKTLWRKKLKNILSQIGADQDKKQCYDKLISSYIRQHLFHFLNKHSLASVIIGGYAPLSEEVCWYHEVMDFEDSFAFPDCRRDLTSQDEMSFYQAKLGDLEESKHFKVKLMTPSYNAREIVPDILLVPGLGFSFDGKRLGRGKGYYDKYLSNFHGESWGICYSQQVFRDLPFDLWDQKIHYLICENGVQNCRVK